VAVVAGALFLGGGMVVFWYPAWLGLVAGLGLVLAGAWLARRASGSAGARRRKARVPIVRPQRDDLSNPPPQRQEPGGRTEGAP
jgi:hypothetical protein